MSLYWILTYCIWVSNIFSLYVLITSRRCSCTACNWGWSYGCISVCKEVWNSLQTISFTAKVITMFLLQALPQQSGALGLECHMPFTGFNVWPYNRQEYIKKLWVCYCDLNKTEFVFHGPEALPLNYPPWIVWHIIFTMNLMITSWRNPPKTLRFKRPFRDKNCSLIWRSSTPAYHRLGYWQMARHCWCTW